MKTIGLLGGMSWESTSTYYRLINEGIKHRLGGLHSAKIALYSVDFDEIEELQRIGDWAKAATVLSEAAIGIEKAGAAFLVICTNTMHKIEPEIVKSITIPVLHIADATAAILAEDGICSVGLLGTKFTMEQYFYKGRLADKFNLDVIVPSEDDQNIIHQIIYNELCLGKILDTSREIFVQVINRLKTEGAQAVILGCTEIPLLVCARDVTVPLYDTTAIHAQKAVELALEK
jgi:aspartate racemase